MHKRGWQDISEPGAALKTKMRVRSNGMVEVEYEQDNLNEVLEVNTALQNADRRSSTLWGGKDRVWVGSIPEEVVHKWLREGINLYRYNEQDRERALKKLNDGDWSKLRVDGRAKL